MVRDSSKDWCAIWSTFIVALAIVLFGLLLMIRAASTEGLVLVFCGGGVMVLAVCAALGKCTSGPAKDPLPDVDRPPSYRVSWRRSFLHRNQQRRSPAFELTEVSDGTGGTHPSGHTTSDHPHTTITQPVPVPSIPILSLPIPDQVPPSAPSSIISGPGGILSHDSSTRHTQSLSNVNDPPPYEVALAGMDEGTLRKLKSEICLPSAPLD